VGRAVRLSALIFYVMVFVLALAPSIFFGRWLSAQKWERKDKIAAWDPFIKVMAIAGAVIIGLASFERFLDQHRQELAKEMLDRSEQRNAAFNQAIKATSTIATAVDLNGTDIANAVTTFWQLYWGELARFEGPQVERAMVDFGKELQIWQHTGKQPERMDVLAYQVAKACRTEIETIQKQIDDLKNRYALFLGGS
jgi:hypothetical protein